LQSSLNLPFALADQTGKTNLVELSEKIEKIKTSLLQYNQNFTFSIGGGSARNLLDHLLFNKDINMRDLDIFVIAHQNINQTYADQLGQYLESQQIGQYSQTNLRPRPRGNPALSPLKQYHYNAGYGFFILSNSEIIDISIFHTIDDLKLNGILNYDKITIPLHQNETLLDWSKKIQPQLSIDSMIEQGLFLDPEHGYLDWTHHTYSSLNWSEVNRDPYQATIRIVRSLDKINSSLSENDFNQIKQALKNTPISNNFQIIRNLLKLLEDPHPDLSLTTLAQMNVIRAWSPALNDAILAQTPRKMSLLLNSDSGMPLDKKLENLFTLVDLKDKIKLLTELKQIKSKEIDLLSKTIIYDIMTSDWKPLDKSSALKSLGIHRIAYFTGEFGPFHHGHLNVANQTLLQSDVDLVFVIPTPFVTHDPKVNQYTQKEWLERISFVDIALKNESKILAWPNLTTFKKLVQTLPNSPTLLSLIQQLESTLPTQTPLTHIAGMDSFYRIRERDLIKNDPRPRIIVERTGVTTPNLLADEKQKIQIIKTDNFPPISATHILQQIALDNPPENINSDVVKQLLEYPRYQKIISNIQTKIQTVHSLLTMSDNINNPDVLKQKTVILIPLLNESGYFSEATDSVESFYKDLIGLFIKKYHYNGKILIKLHPNYSNATITRLWKNTFLSQPNVSIVTNIDSIPNSTKSSSTFFVTSS
jgi:nicotinic acid mononucleotide adenylyltransferase